MNKQRVSLQIVLLATVVLVLLVTSLPVDSQSPDVNPMAQHELDRSHRANAPVFQWGKVTGFSGGGGGAIQKATLSTMSGPRSPAPAVDNTDAPPIGYEHGDAAYQMAKQAANQSKQNPVRKSATNAGDSAGPQVNGPNAPLAPPAQGVSYQAVNYTGWIPPDPIIAVTPQDVIVAVNSSFSIFDKANPGNLLYSNTFANWFNCCGISLPAGTSIFDPKLVYDFINQRVVMVALAKNTTVSPYKSWFLVSVSQQPSAIGYWYNYAFDATLNASTSTTNYADYTQIGTDGTNLYVSANMFASGGGFQYIKIRMLKLSELYGGSTPSGWWDFWGWVHANSTMAFSVQPAHHYFSGPPMYFVSAENNLSASSGNILTVFRIDLPASNNWPSVAPTAWRIATITTANTFSVPPNAAQPGTSTLIDTGDDRILSARYWGGDIWVTQGCQNPVNFNAGLCVYGLTSGGTEFYEISGWNSTGFDYYYPSLAADWDENIAIVFSRSSPSEYASIRYTGKRWTNNGNLEGSALVKSGEDTYVNVYNGRNRWGDYTGVERDPANGITFWLFNEYAKPQVSGVGRWSTWIFTAYFPLQTFLPFITK
jgi:hypothetical protein